MSLIAFQVHGMDHLDEWFKQFVSYFDLPCKYIILYLIKFDSYLHFK